LASAILATIALTLVVPIARADTKSELEAAKARLARINDEVHAQQATLARLSKQAEAVAWRVQVAEGKLQQVQAELDKTRVDIADATSKYQALQARLAERAREMFIQGPGAAAGFLLGATSLTDLSDRVEFSSAVARSDADLATGVANLRNRLEIVAGQQTQLTADRASALDTFRGQLAELNTAFAREQQISADIAAKRSEAVRVVSRLNRKLQAELAARIPTGTTVVTGSPGGAVSIQPFGACPVGQPLALTDSFGAPRYGGGYHLHAGVDIMAPTGTPIYATFAGVAEDASNTLGGLAVRVVGSDGWTYNAHMSQIGQLGPVQAGDVIGYIGATGDTSVSHNHFEWHPNAIPSPWPASAYGYSVVGDAVNPYPVLVGIC
jgi:murein DD-endopeptidase MepM/ murein hydrolase activator NlpD